MMLVMVMTDNDDFDDRSGGDGGDGDGVSDGVMRKCAAEDLGPHMCVCARSAEVGERKRQKTRGDSGLSAGHTTTSRMAQVGTQLLLGWHKWAHNTTHGGTNRQTAVAQVGTQHIWVNKGSTWRQKMTV